ncbi:phospholipase [Pseudalkalibacillus caeni]|uniref:Phospholipase n=2 Tax=Exobacillus caeni TaxID=2574798 RepID=A0A5R9F0F2_9BACL|nr:phospholipase [Pseudalkalibacillus caeni]TLS37007.1 phospholipase [Pseudalkalibacillus caeni]
MEKKRGPRPGFCIFPGYKWCGPGCSGPEEPINEVDAACKAHDFCYKKYGPSCKCDIAFMKQLEPLVNPYTEEGRHAQVMYQYMKFRTMFTCL